jgi:hypothetical protein
MLQAAADAGRDLSDCLLLAPLFYSDVFKLHCSQQEQADRIYMCLGNKHIDNLLRSVGKLLLCLVPEGADFLEVIMHIVVQPMRQLECGTLIKFVAADHMFWCYSSVFSFLGDHPLQALVAGTVPALHCLFNKCSSLSLLCGEKGVAGTCAFYCCHYCHTHQHVFLCHQVATRLPHNHH